MAKAAEAGGADILSLINTLTGMKIDIYKKTFALANKTGGMSGPAVKPVAVRMVYQVAQAVKLPIIGMAESPLQRMRWNLFLQVQVQCLWELQISLILMLRKK